VVEIHWVGDGMNGKQPIKTGRGANLRNGPGKGRPKGSLNKTTKALKDIVLGSLAKAGGMAYLARQAVENPQAYLQLLGKVLPQDINATVTAKPWTPEQADEAVEEALENRS